MQHSGEIYAWK